MLTPFPYQHAAWFWTFFEVFLNCKRWLGDGGSVELIKETERIPRCAQANLSLVMAQFSNALCTQLLKLKLQLQTVGGLVVKQSSDTLEKVCTMMSEHLLDHSGFDGKMPPDDFQGDFFGISLHLQRCIEVSCRSYKAHSST